MTSWVFPGQTLLEDKIWLPDLLGWRVHWEECSALERSQTGRIREREQEQQQLGCCFWTLDWGNSCQVITSQGWRRPRICRQRQSKPGSCCSRRTPRKPFWESGERVAREWPTNICRWDLPSMSATHIWRQDPTTTVKDMIWKNLLFNPALFQSRRIKNYSPEQESRPPRRSGRCQRGRRWPHQPHWNGNMC